MALTAALEVPPFWEPGEVAGEPLYRQGDLLPPLAFGVPSVPAEGALLLNAKDHFIGALHRAPLVVVSQCCTISSQLRGGSKVAVLVCPIKDVAISQADLTRAQDDPAGGSHIGMLWVVPVTGVIPETRVTTGRRGASVELAQVANFNDIFSLKVDTSRRDTRPTVAARMTVQTRAMLRSRLAEFFARPAAEDLG